MTAAGRVYHASLDLLDRQMRDRNGIECGNVDDLEICRNDDGDFTISAILAGPGVLWYRLGRRRLGSWIQRVHRRGGFTDEDDRTRIPIELAFNIAASIDVAVDRADLATTALERWTGDHFIGHIPGSAHDADD
jgi:hypothetical protein